MKINKFGRNYKIGLMLAIMSLTGVAAVAQPSKQFAQAQQENEAKLRTYSWKSRTEIRKGGETRSIQLNQMRYDVEGTLQQTPLSATKAEIPTGGLRGLIARKKKEEFVKMLDALSVLAKSYGKLPPEKMQRFMTNATITSEMTSQKKLLRIQGRDVLQPGDSMTIWFDPATHQQQKIEIQTTFENKPLRIVSEFRDLPSGPTYLARSLVDYPDQELAIVTENFEYTRKP